MKATPIKSSVGALLIAVFILMATMLPSFARVTPEHFDDYFEREYEWVAYLEVREDKTYLNYKRSSLKPLTHIRVVVRSFPHSQRVSRTVVNEKLYEELWYQREAPIGLRRHSLPEIAPYAVGAICVKMTGAKEQAESVANAVLRVLIDLKFRRLTTAMVLVPNEQFEAVQGRLEHYGFTRGMSNTGARQLGIRLCSFVGGREEQLYWQSR